MTPMLRFLISRILLIPLTLFVVTATLMALLSTVPAEVRALQYIPKRIQYQYDIRSHLKNSFSAG